MTLITKLYKMTGVIIGSVTERILCHAFAPSIVAASYKAFGTP